MPRRELVTLLLAASKVVGLRVHAPSSVSRRDAVRRVANVQMEVPVRTVCSWSHDANLVLTTARALVSVRGRAADESS